MIFEVAETTQTIMKRQLAQLVEHSGMKGHRFESDTASLFFVSQRIEVVKCVWEFIVAIFVHCIVSA